MRVRWLALLIILSFALLVPPRAWAGMPSFTVADLAHVLRLTSLTRARLEAISFFLIVFLVCVRLVQIAWNALGKDVAWLPRLSYGKALGLVFLWGLLFVLVLTMISGARELMTPGAWEKNGLTYRLVKETDLRPADIFDPVRYERLEQLSEALADFAQKHQGRFPVESELDQLDAHVWLAASTPNARFVYYGGVVDKEHGKPLAAEPEALGPFPLVLFTDGMIHMMTREDLRRARAGEGP
ncbi:MAG TPA: hypothetical protein VGY53_06250 [Isosphaeraceae bacterium]|nr:hypothetical protein [Isosphaeraceae bacterium]